MALNFRANVRKKSRWIQCLHVADLPDATQKERAAHFGVSRHCIWYGLQTLNITRKKKTRTYKEQYPVKRQAYLLALQEETVVGGKVPVYVDETGFSETDFREYAYASKGICVEDKVASHRYTTTTLIAARLDGCFTVPCAFRGELRCDCLQCVAFGNVVSFA